MSTRVAEGIADVLAAAGVPGPRVRAWNVSTLHGILRNRTYLGEVVRPAAPEGSEPLRVAPLVSEDLFERAQARLDAMRLGRRRRHADDAYLLQGLGRCGHSKGGPEHVMGAFVSRRRRPDGATVFYRYYRCVRRQLPRRYGDAWERCDGPSVRADVVDAQVWAQIELLLANPDLFAERLLATSGLADVEERLRLAKEEERKAAQALVRLEEGVLLGDIPRERYSLHRSTFQKRLDAAGRERRQAERMLRALEARRLANADLRALARTYAGSLGTLSFETKRKIVQTLVAKAVFAGREVRIVGHGVVFESVTLPRHGAAS
jgi:hypothetical protein